MWHFATGHFCHGAFRPNLGHYAPTFYRKTEVDMLSRRRMRDIQVKMAMEKQAIRVQASKKGAIAVLAFCASLGFLAGFLAAQRGFCS